MFDASVYKDRRKGLKAKIGSGVILLFGNDESPMNYSDNTFGFRQDSSFLYYWGLDDPGLAAFIDVEDDKEIVFGNDLTVAEIVWTGPQPLIKEKSARAGVSESAPMGELANMLATAIKHGKQIHFLPQYRAENVLKLEQLLGLHPRVVNAHASVKLIKAVAEQRRVKSAEEIREIERAVDITGEMHVAAMKRTRPRMVEREIAGLMEGIAVSRGGNLAFPIIFSIHGETLHNHFHGNVMKDGDLVVNDTGAESELHYAGDITRTFPVSGRMSARQRDVYSIVLRAQAGAMKIIKPGVRFNVVHMTAARLLAEGLKDLGLMRGDLDAAVAAGAHALFFQCGVGHLMGLDVHDMENLGEQYVGYDDVTPRSSQFGLCYLRLVRMLEPGFVVTVEPGLYFIPQLIDEWRAEKKFSDFINYEKVEEYRNFGGVRIEDDVLVTTDGCRVLGTPIPKTIDEVEATCVR